MDGLNVEVIGCFGFVLAWLDKILSVNAAEPLYNSNTIRVIHDRKFMSEIRGKDPENTMPIETGRVKLYPPCLIEALSKQISNIHGWKTQRT